MIISLFGPDGVGKSTVAEALRTAGCLVFSGTGVADWPDQTWYDELSAKGLHEPSIDNQAHFLEKIERLHLMATRLAGNKIVVIDSNPFHKTLAYDYSRAEKDGKDGRKVLQERFKALARLANMDTDYRHVYFQISPSLDDTAQAAILQERVDSRTQRAYFDPRSTTQSLGMVRGYKAVAEAISNTGASLVTVYTQAPVERTVIERLIVA